MTQRDIDIDLSNTVLTVSGASEPLENLSTFCLPFIKSRPGTESFENFSVDREDGHYRLVNESEKVIEAETLDLFLMHFTHFLTRRFLESLPPSTLAIHSAGLLKKDRAILMYGPRDAGKTTAVNHLLDPPFTFLSDELVAYDLQDERIFPFPRNLHFDRPENIRSMFRQFELKTPKGKSLFVAQPPLEHINRSPVSVEHLHLIELNREGSPTKLQSTSPGQGIMRLLTQCVKPRDAGDKVTAMGELARKGVSFYTLYYKEIQNAKAELKKLVI